MPRPPRRHTVPVALVVVAACCLAMALRADAEPDPADASATSDAPAPVTPVLSARRVPEMLLAPVSDEALVAATEPILGAVPPDTCVAVSRAGGPVLEHQVDQPLVPASNQKFLVAAAAMGALGPDHTFTTTVSGTAAPQGGVVDGDLWLVGGGDPLLETEGYVASKSPKELPELHSSMESLADAVVAAGVTQVTGSVVGDGTRYDSVRYVPSWPDRYETQNQTGPMGALMVNDGFADFPSDPASSAEETPSADPAQHAAAVLTELLRERGVQVAEEADVGEAPGGAVPIVEHPSLPLSQIVAQFMGSSDNTTSELMVKELGFVTAGEGSTEAGVAAITGLLTDAGYPMDGVVVMDGSGLDESNAVTCRLLMAILAADGPHGPVGSGMAVAAQSGTLVTRFVGGPAAGRLRAKTGTLNEVTALSGWVSSVGGVELSFSYISNLSGGTTLSDSLELERDLGEAIAVYAQSPTLQQVGPVPVAPG